MNLPAIRTELLERISCPQCWGSLAPSSETALSCAACGHEVALQNGIPVFTPPPAGLVPSKKIPRSPHSGTPWRQANWRFLEQQVAQLDPQALILDVGSGRGDFEAVLKSHHTVALDIYPYPEVDIVCDLTQVNPFRSNSFDAVVLMNVLEHIYDTHGLLASLASLLKPGGVLIVAIPFMVKMHQVPVDFVRYTHFALERLGQEHGLAAEKVEGYYDSVFFLYEGISNLRWSVLPALKRSKRYFARLLLEGVEVLASGLNTVIGRGRVEAPAGMRNLAPIGYHVVYRKTLSQAPVDAEFFSSVTNPEKWSKE